MRSPTLSLYALRSLGRALARWPAARGRGVDPELRERVIVHVSSLNSCPVCLAFHAGDARSRTLDGTDPRDPRLDAALRYAELRTLGRERFFPGDVARFERSFSPVEQAALRATVDLFTFTNRFNNTWEQLVPGAAARRRRLRID